MPISDTPQFSRPIWAEVDLAALRSNFEALAALGPVTMIAVVKANAYGHGAVEVARALWDADPQPAMLAVASVDEGSQLRNAGIVAPILLLSAILPSEARAAVRAGLTPTVFTSEVAAAIDAAGRAEGRIAEAHFKIDTGMGRLGAACDEAVELWKSFQTLPNLRIGGVYTHFACADEEDDPMSAVQLVAFKEFLAAIAPLERNVLVHAANSAAQMRYPEARFAIARCGVSLYGASPSPCSNPFGVALLPVMALRARITHVREVRAGTSISYGATWRAARDSRIATLPAGYADGYSRSLSNRGQVLVGGQRCPIVGRVTMDITLIDITDLEVGVDIGETVTLFGPGLPAEEVAAWAGTIPYEIFTSVAGRVSRIYSGG